MKKNLTLFILLLVVSGLAAQETEKTELNSYLGTWRADTRQGPVNVELFLKDNLVYGVAQPLGGTNLPPVPEGYFIKDLQWKNGTLQNGKIYLPRKNEYGNVSMRMRMRRIKDSPQDKVDRRLEVTVSYGAARGKRTWKPVIPVE